MDAWRQLGTRHGVAIDVSGLPALASLGFRGPRATAYKTLLAQEMLAKGYLASVLVYAATVHTAEVVEKYVDALDSVFALIGQCEADREDVMRLLKGPVSHSGFKRLN